MKTLSMILVFCMVLALSAGNALSSDHKEHHASSAKFYGTVEAMPKDGFEGKWIIDGREIIVTKDTFIEEKYGKAAPGVYVEVKGNRSGNTIIAYEIEIKRSIK